MKPIALIIFSALIACKSQSQEYQEFRSNPNGLLYSDSAMARLRLMVNTQNILFKTCDLNKTFYSYPQARVFSVHFKSKHNDLKKIKSAMNNGESFYNVLALYSSFITSLDSGRISIQLKDIEEGKEKPYFLIGSPQEGYSGDYLSGNKGGNIAPNSWSYDYEEPDKYDKEYRLDAKWYPEPFHQKSIPTEYGKLIQYVDCMIDTSTQVFLSGHSYSYFSDETETKNNKVISYIQQKAKEACINLSDKESGNLTQTQFAARELSNDPVFIQIIKDEVANTVDAKKSDEELEYLCAALGLKQEQLTLMRCRRVMGMCSMDESPRLHALQIASLAGEVQQWDIFMRAHMDILNDRFERMSDGSYAWEQRQTYLKELEELGLHVTDIMLGMSLRAQNTSFNHYSGTVWRSGKAMTECTDRKNFENRVIQMMYDVSLDDFNRGLCFLLLSSYLHRLPDINEANDIIQTLKSDNTLSATDHVGMAINKMEFVKQKEKK